MKQSTQILSSHIILPLLLIAAGCSASADSLSGSDGTSSAAIDSQCQMVIQTNQYNGYCANIVITNTGAQAITGWKLVFQFPASGTVQNLWNATWQQQGTQVVASAYNWNAGVPLGQSVDLGYCATQGNGATSVQLAFDCNNQSPSIPGTTTTTGSTTTGSIGNTNLTNSGGSATTTGSSTIGSATTGSATTGSSTTGSATTGSAGASTGGGTATTTGGPSTGTAPATTGGGTQTQVAFTASSGTLNNPERGFFKWVDIMSGTDLSFVRQAGYSLGYAVVRLDDYRTSAIPSSFLSTLNNGFAAARAAHIKLIVRFAYNYPGTDPDGGATADTTANYIVGHTQQLAPVIAENVDVIATVEAGFIGEWAEWHDSTSGLDDPSDRLTVMNAVLAAVPSTRHVLIRYPYEKQENWQGPVSAQQAFGTSALARIGHHNDCFLDGADDGGTYHSDSDRTYLAADTFYVPEGGETCSLDSPRSDCPAALSDLATYHWAFLNADFDTDVINAWGSQGCLGTITNQLGYLLTLQSASLSSQVSVANGTLALKVNLHNSGYARIYNPRPVYVVLNGPSGRVNYLLQDDPRTWDPGADAVIQANIALGTIPTGTYTVAIWMPDAASGLQGIADYSIQFANTGTWDATNGYNIIATGLVAK